MNTRTRNKYDTILIYLFITGNEHLIPAEIRNSIPYSTQATWRGYASEKYIGNTLRYMFDEGIRTANLHNKHKHIKQFLKAMENIYVTMATILDTIKLPLYQVKAHRQTIIDLIQLHSPTVGLDKLIAYFRISKTTYHNWLLDVKVKCSASYFELCTRKYGTQLTKPETLIMKDALTNPKYTHWPVASIAYHYQRENLLHATVNTWYKYRKLFGMARTTFRKVHKRVGIVSTRVNEYWHVDITHVTTNDDIKHCVYFLCDNFSRKILAWRVAPNVSWQYVKECITDAYQATSLNALPLNIVSDGGPENTHHSLVHYVDTLLGTIKKRIALKDIQFSNSPIEAKNRTFKMYYFNPKDVANLVALNEVILFFIVDFNNTRPMGVLKGFTPHEVYTNTKPLINFKADQVKAAQQRSTSNTTSVCNACAIIYS